MSAESQLSTLLANTIRALSMDGVQKANSGHPGMPLGTADMAAVLWSEFLRFNPQDPEWEGRDRFVLSAGHGSMLLYSLLHLFGFELPVEQLKDFRQLGSITPGHPEFGMTPGVETTTGPLGQGFANGVGMALGAKMLQARYDQNLFNQRIFGIVSDGDLMEGVASEAASLAGHLKLGNIIYLYDMNSISIGGSTDICFTEDVAKRFEAYGWHVLTVDGHNHAELRKGIAEGIAEESKPTLVCCRTTIGFGSPNKAGSADSHGSPLGEDEIVLTKKELGWEEEAFSIPATIKDFCASVVSQNQQTYNSWQSDYKVWAESNSGKAQAWSKQAERLIPEELESELVKALSGTEKKATRALSGEALQVIASKIPFLVGGSADLEPSNKTLIKDSSDIQATDFSQRNIRFGVREHAMGSMVNGLAYSKSWIPYTGTFLVFADYMRPAIRLAALSHLQSLFIFTHDSFWVGEDGPTHQPIEQIMSLRLIPNHYLFRPADGAEVAGSYLAALNKKDAPASLLFTRQGVPALERETEFSAADILKGAYVVSGKSNTELTIVATGSEVWLAQAAAKLLEEKGRAVRVVSMPCMELFYEQTTEYQESIIPNESKKVSIEAGSTLGWQRVVGSDGLCIGIDHFGASAPGGVLAEKFGFTPQAVTDRIIGFI